MNKSLSRDLGMAIVGAAVVALFAQISFDVGKIPITGQSFAVLVMGYLLGARGAAMAMILYLLLGALGLGVFAGGASGWEKLTGFGGGYLWSFIPAAALLGALREMDKSILSSFLAMALGTALILGIGAIWLGFHIGFAASWSSGVSPFLAGAAIKVVAGGLTMHALGKWL